MRLLLLFLVLFLITSCSNISLSGCLNSCPEEVPALMKKFNVSDMKHEILCSKCYDEGRFGYSKKAKIKLNGQVYELYYRYSGGSSSSGFSKVRCFSVDTVAPTDLFEKAKQTMCFEAKNFSKPSAVCGGEDYDYGEDAIKSCLSGDFEAVGDDYLTISMVTNGAWCRALSVPYTDENCYALKR